MASMEQSPASCRSSAPIECTTSRNGHGVGRAAKLTHAERVELQRIAGEAMDESLRMRAEIILSWANGETGDQSAARLSTSRRTVSKWRSRFRAGGIPALVDAPRPGAPRSVDSAKIDLLFQLRESPPPRGYTRWTTRMLAEETGLSQSTVVRVVREVRERSS